MAVTTVKTSADVWTAVAVAGDATITSIGQYGAYWAITQDAAGPTPVPPTLAIGHRARPDTDISMTLSGSERLWFKGVDPLVVTADAPV